jgi:hypothetical protein
MVKSSSPSTEKAVCLGNEAMFSVDWRHFLASTGHAFEERILGLTVPEWNDRWVARGLLTGDFTDLRTSVGLYRARFQGDVVYLGKAVEHSNGGLNKRLRDYTRPNPSARLSGAGQRLHELRDRIDIDVLVTGHDAKAAHAAEQLERYFIEKYPDGWNIVGRKR